MLRSGRLSRPTQNPTRRDGGHLAADDGLTALAGALQHPDPDVRARAVLVVAEFGDDRAARMLQSMIHDRSPAVRSIAVSAAARTKNMDVVLSLIVALEDPALEVRRAAAEALSSVTGRSIETSDVDGAVATVASEEVEDLKRWWKDKRFRDLSKAEDKA
jgi:HEAT repeat protein